MWNSDQQQGTWWPNLNYQLQATAEGKYLSISMQTSQYSQESILDININDLRVIGLKKGMVSDRGDKFINLLLAG